MALTARLSEMREDVRKSDRDENMMGTIKFDLQGKPSGTIRIPLWLCEHWLGHPVQISRPPEEHEELRHLNCEREQMEPQGA